MTEFGRLGVTMYGWRDAEFKEEDYDDGDELIGQLVGPLGLVSLKGLYQGWGRLS